MIIIKTIKIEELKLFVLYQLDKKQQVFIKDFKVYPINENNTLVLFPSNYIQEILEYPSYNVIAALENNEYKILTPKIVYELIDERQLNKDTRQEVI